jgi:hypothetical protein
MISSKKQTQSTIKYLPMLLPQTTLTFDSPFNGNGQRIYLKDILIKGKYKGLIPNKVILDKTIPGLGATSCEIESKRHSIIIEPNVPVIDDKPKQYPNDRWLYKVLGVKKGVEVEDIINYLNDVKVRYKKIITTPESFWKVKRAFSTLGINYQHDYFLLMDECEKVVQDADFREGMFLIMQDFFQFRKKAMVSATPILPSDGLFKTQQFKSLVVKPEFDYSTRVTLVSTNNFLKAVTSIFKSHQDSVICFFVNSITLITQIIDALNIRESSHIYCSEKSFAALKEASISNYSDCIEVINGQSTVSQYNFFTSRFFSAVDIKINGEKPIIIMLSDLYKAPQTILDPRTHIKQIIGRCRNGVSKAYHITNYKANITVRSKEYWENYYQAHFDAYKALHAIYRNERNIVKVEAYSEALKSMKIFNFLYKFHHKYRLNRYLLDNDTEREEVKKLYRNEDSLYYLYSQDEFYMVNKHPKFYRKDDSLLAHNEGLALPELRKHIVETQEEILNGSKDGMLEDYFTEEQLNKEKGKILGAYNYLDKDTLEAFKYKIEDIQNHLSTYLDEQTSNNFNFKQLVHDSFKVNESYSFKYIQKELQRIISNYLPGRKPKAVYLTLYCAVENTNIGKRGFKLPEEKRPKGFKILQHL